MYMVHGHHCILTWVQVMVKLGLRQLYPETTKESCPMLNAMLYAKSESSFKSYHLSIYFTDFVTSLL